jgi:peroxiredoxin
MKNRLYTLALGFLLPIFLLSSALFKGGKVVNDFKLKNVDGKMVSLKDFRKAKGFILVFTCNHCPFAKLYPPRLNALNEKYKPLGVPLIAISSTDTIAYQEDTYPKMVAKAKAENFNFPYLFDGEQRVARDFGADKTPHAFVIWKEKRKWVVRYDGAIDDNGMEPDKVETHYVADAVEALLHKKEVAVPQTKSIGCKIYFRD